jgi:hypothetical protein
MFFYFLSFPWDSDFRALDFRVLDFLVLNFLAFLTLGLIKILAPQIFFIFVASLL